LLQELAWHFHRQGLRYFPEREMQAEIAHFLPALGLPADEAESIAQRPLLKLELPPDSLLARAGGGRK